jgi:hypothetical protein
LGDRHINHGSSEQHAESRKIPLPFIGVAYGSECTPPLKLTNTRTTPKSPLFYDRKMASTIRKIWTCGWSLSGGVKDLEGPRKYAGREGGTICPDATYSIAKTFMRDQRTDIDLGEF